VSQQYAFEPLSFIVSGGYAVVLLARIYRISRKRPWFEAFLELRGVFMKYPG
jgi:hypothetical protein